MGYAGSTWEILHALALPFELRSARATGLQWLT